MEWVELLGKVYRNDGTSLFVALKESELPKALDILLSHEVHWLLAITGHDNGKEIEVMYHFRKRAYLITLKILLPRNSPVLQSITAKYPSAELYERELSEMLGVKLAGHPDPRKLHLSEGSPKQPMRKVHGKKKEFGDQA